MKNQLIYFCLGILGLIILWNVYLQISLQKIKKFQRILFTGKKAQSLEKIITENQQLVLRHSNELENLRKTTASIQSLAFRSIHRVGLIRFNPFRDIGGDQSFSLALLDGKKTGLVISSLYSREGVRVYAKSVKEGISTKHPLTEEEKHVIEKASIEKN